MTGVWRRVRVCVGPLLVMLVVVVEEAGWGDVHCFVDGDEGVVLVPEGMGRAFRNTQFLVLSACHAIQPTPGYYYTERKT